MTKEPAGAIVLLTLIIAGFRLLRRYLGPVCCPQCGSGAWIILAEAKQCRECGHLFH